MITIDYGYRSEELYNGSRYSGTLMCYHKHRINDQPYQHIGEQDITAHVNFSALCRFGYNNGLDHCGYSNQADFLLSLGLVEHLKKTEEKHSGMKTEDKGVLLYTLLMDMGRKFKVLIQKKGLDESRLSGMRFPQRIP